MGLPNPTVPPCRVGDGGVCPWCYANRRKRSNFRGHQFYVHPPVRKGYGMALSAMHKAAATGAGASGPAAERDSALLKVFDTLQDYLLETSWDDGTPRQTATLLFFAEEGRWKGMLNDRDGSRVAFVAGSSVKAVLEALEKGLKAGSLDWRASKQQPARKGRA